MIGSITKYDLDKDSKKSKQYFYLPDEMLLDMGYLELQRMSARKGLTPVREGEVIRDGKKANQGCEGLAILLEAHAVAGQFGSMDAIGLARTSIALFAEGAKRIASSQNIPLNQIDLKEVAAWIEARMPAK